MLKVVRVNGLSILEFITLNSNNTTNMIQSWDSTMLWYMRLGHIGDKMVKCSS